MQKFDFNEAVEMVLAEDARYAPAAYHFLRESLDFLHMLLIRMNTWSFY